MHSLRREGIQELVPLSEVEELEAVPNAIILNETESRPCLRRK
jgi:hypothetical protein